MSHHKHHMKMKARGGGLHEKHFEADDKGSKEMSEVTKRKHGGKVEGHKVEGHKGKHRMKKASGGGCDAHPFSSAHRG
jgi:hypothetical protein